MNVPIYSDPEVLEGLYKRFSYLSGQPLRLYGVAAEASSIGTIETDALLAFVAAHLHEAVPYQADFPLLSRAENASLTHYAEVEALEPWPQPLIDVDWARPERAGVITRISHVDMQLKPVGYGQLWWGGEVAVLWEAYFEQPYCSHRDHHALLNRYWELCETYLSTKGVRYVHTYSRDPRFGADWYTTFLADRCYRRDPARDHLPGNSVAVVKHLYAHKGDEDA